METETHFMKIAELDFDNLVDASRRYGRIL